MLRTLDNDSIHRICSGQVVIDLASAIKELIENAIDSGATLIEIKLKDMGLESIEVSDNGCGIEPNDYNTLATKHCTSKLDKFSDLDQLKSFGFRGEALNALCELSSHFTVLTKQKSQSLGYQLFFNSDGSLHHKEPISKSNGTTVVVTNLFETLPVRRAEFIRSIKKQYQKMLKLLQSYALIITKAKLNVINITTKGQRQQVMEIQATSRLEENISTVFGSKFLNNLTSIDLKMKLQSNQIKTKTTHSNSSDQTEHENNNDHKPVDSLFQSFLNFESNENDSINNNNDLAALNDAQCDDTIQYDDCHIVGYVSKINLGVGRSDNDRQYVYCNGRPVDMPRISKALNEVWRKYEMKQKPAFIINVILPPHCYDINLSPDKREVIFTHTDEIISALYDYVDALYSPSRFTFQLSQGVQKQNSMAEFSWGSLPTATASSRQSSHTLLNDAEECDDAADQAEESCQNQEDFTEEQSNAKEDEVGTFEKSVTASTRLNDRIRQRSALLEKLVKPAVIHTIAENIGKKSPSSNNRRDLSASSLQNDLMSDECIFETDSLNETTLSDDEEKPMALSLVGQSSPFFHATSSNNVSVSNHQCQLEKISNGIIWNIMNQDEIITKHQHLLSKKRKVLEVDSSSRNRQKVSCNTSLREITEFHDSGSLHQSNDKVIQHEKLKTITNVDNTVTMLATDSANELLMDMSARVLTKDDFRIMKVIGQFNLGFIIAQHQSDLYILDQHACDEKYRYETLQKSTTLHQQPLFHPLQIDSTPSEEMLIIEYLECFQLNGFSIHIDENAPIGKKLTLRAIPFSKSTQFGCDDIHELASILDMELHSGMKDIIQSKIAIKNDDMIEGISYHRHLSERSDQQNRVDRGEKKFIRLPKILSMFASRACRSSVMIGTALEHIQMNKIVSNLSLIEQPWNCPHGRPTMRHLIDLEAV